MWRFLNILCRKCYLNKKPALFILLICLVYYIHPKKIKLLDQVCKVEIDLPTQRHVKNYSPKIYGVSNMIRHHSYFTKTYHFLQLPKRKKHVSFSEMTSSNPDTANPLSPDFSFHLSYYKRSVKIFEDYGCGCIHRIYILPPFSSFQDRIDSLMPEDMKDLKIIIELDETSTSYTLKEMMLPGSYPFFYPLTSQNIKPMSGIGAYTQLCYDKSAKIYYVDDHEYPSNILNMTVECVSNELKCPVKQYSSISYLKVPLALQGSTNDLNKENIKDLNTVAKLFQNPISNGPHSDVGCNLFCEPLKAGKVSTLYDVDDYSGIITSMLLTILNLKNEKVAQDWSNIFLVAHFDGATSPQVNVSVESLFISRGLDNDFKGAGYGRMNRNCYFGLEGQYRRNDLLNVGYLYLPMPFWRSAKISLHHPRLFRTQLNPTKMACYRLTESKNFYNSDETGHLQVSQVFHSGQTDKRREVLQTVQGWGHLVGVGVEVHNLRPNLEGSLIQRWAALQADPLVYVDGLATPRVRGTGLEDYFSYAHGFAGAANTSYSFVGVPLAMSDKDDGNAWICYRQHLLDPITFDDSLEFIMEGTHKNHYTSKAENISYEDYLDKLYTKETVFSYLALFYYKAHPIEFRNKVCHKMILCDESSRLHHNFRSSHSGTKFNLEDVRFIGDVINDRSSDINCGMSFHNQTIINFSFSLSISNNPKLILKRTFHMHPFQWNDLCRIEMNGVDLGLWTFPMGPTTPKYSLRDEFVEIWIPNLEDTSLRSYNRSFDFRITVLSQWRDVSYELCDVR